jgi:hypothetical protein
MTDFHPGYAEACGTCIEIACDQDWIHDNYGEERCHNMGVRMRTALGTACI